MSKLISVSALLACIILAGAFGPRPALLQTTAQISRPGEELRINAMELKSTVALPCPPGGKAVGTGASDEGKTRVSTATNTDIPVNFHYSVTGGRVVGTGPTVVWDLNGSAPGEYAITAQIDDGVGHRSEAVTKKITLAGQSCTHSCTCPVIIVSSPTAEVRPKDSLAFEVQVFGGDAFEPKFSWTVENGTIRSGQGTDSVDIIATGEVGSLVTATIYIGGFDPYCNSAMAASESVRIGRETVARDFPLRVDSLNLDERTVYIECPKGHLASVGSPRSDDMIVAVSTLARSNSIRDRLKYVYNGTGGTITGSGSHVSWDLTGYGAGLYEMSVAVDGGRGLTETKKQTVAVRERECGPRMECPTISPLSVSRIGKSNDYIVRSSVAGTIPEIVWTVTGGTIIAGQGTNSIRVRSRWMANDPTPSAEISLLLPDGLRDFCDTRTSASVVLVENKTRR